MSDDDVTRRPLKSRGAAWASWLSRALLRTGFTPNVVSLASVAFAAAAGASMIMAAHLSPAWPWWLAAAAAVQLRLVCNLMDGMLAVEGGLKSPTGELFNELPDRLADACVLAPLGYAGGSDVTIALGWAAACGAVGTAYLRAVGAHLTGRQDFRGPMAKPQRMAAVTAVCLAMAVLAALDRSWPVPGWGLAVIVAGIAITCAGRIRRLAKALTA